MDNVCNVTTGEVRMSYVHLFKPYAAMPGQEEKYSVTVLVPKTDMDTMGRINAAIEAAKQRGISEKWSGQCPPILPTPVYDGDGVRPSDGMAFGPECKGHWVFTASAKADYPPEIVDRTGNPIINQSEVYSGMYGRVNVTQVTLKRCILMRLQLTLQKDILFAFGMEAQCYQMIMSEYASTMMIM